MVVVALELENTERIPLKDGLIDEFSTDYSDTLQSPFVG